MIGVLRQLNTIVWVSILGQFACFPAPKYWATNAVLKPMMPMKKEEKAKDVKPPLKQAFIASALTCLRQSRSMNINIATVDVEIMSGRAMSIIGLIPPGPSSDCRSLIVSTSQKLMHCVIMIPTQTWQIFLLNQRKDIDLLAFWPNRFSKFIKF